jgi:antitoxin component HigA of HigAB toxin-antitoxin module
VESPTPSPPPSASGEATPAQVQNIKAHLDLVLLALEALTGVGSEAMLAAAQTLGLEALMGDRVSLWRLRQASPLRQGQGRKKLDVDEARALVLVSAHLAQAQTPQIRKAVAALEKATTQGKAPYRVAVLGDYLDRFSNLYQDRMAADDASSMDALTELALKLLVDLLFYSQPQGAHRLWGALLERSQRPQSG